MNKLRLYEVTVMDTRATDIVLAVAYTGKEAKATVRERMEIDQLYDVDYYIHHIDALEVSVVDGHEIVVKQ